MTRLVSFVFALELVAGVYASPSFSLFKRATSSSSSTTTSDTCARVDGQLTVTKSNGKSYTAGSIHTCLCVSQLPQFIVQNTVAASAVTAAGQTATIAALTSLIDSSSSSSQCTYPEHSSPSCQNSNPCYFSCTDGYSLSSSGKDCQCKTPFKECNGKCGHYPSCSSRRALSGSLEGLLRREPDLMGTERRGSKMLSREEAKKQKEFQGKKIAAKLGCPWGTMACGVFGGSRKAWECVDTANDLESCGGCMLPLAPLASTPMLEDLLSFGSDCTAIPGVADVACVSGSCAVSRCEHGWKVSSDASHCVEESPITNAALLGH